ncbi:hypothetical protein HDA32_001900 [Spinactinospora alkalitolerans]|uniref:PH domain-containing protein n=1 Tax=Spinactinospora alkalitolerans TaxID=687207 RepID=A0A852TY54_9ACTN|nr:STM3941 family protein [Spinactinospora alkalitolerans]NYE46780.1 hypothetical protein [Spinactinospora alkalitolerans]
MASPARSFTVRSRFRFTWEGVWLAAGCLVFVAAGVAMVLEGSRGTVVLGTLAIVLFGGGGLLASSSSLSRRPVLEMDDEGVCVAVPWPRNRIEDHRLPWDRIAGITAYTQKIPYQGGTAQHHYLAFVPQREHPSPSADGEVPSIEPPWELRYSLHIRSSWNHDVAEIVEEARRRRPDLHFTDRRAPGARIPDDRASGRWES